MICPLTCDGEWSSTFKELPEWLTPMCSTIVISPHPDDETLGAGGLISMIGRAGVDVLLVAVTDGENAYEDASNLGRARKGEQEEASVRLGVATDRIIRLRLPDRSVAQHEDELFHQLLPLATGNSHIIAPWTGDFHPDHEACGRAAQRVSREVGASITSYFFWTWHRGTPQDIRGLPLRILRLDSEAMRAKCEALQCHRSQLEHVSGNPILPKNLLGPARWPFEVFLPA